MNVINEMKDGDYTGEIIDITSEITSSGAAKVTWLLRIIGGEHDGACVEKKYYLKSKGAMGFLKKKLKLIGFEVEDGKELKAKKSQIIGTKITFTALNNDQGYLAFYVKGAVTGVTKKAMPEETETDFW